MTTRGWTTFEIDWESYGKDYAEALKKAGYSSVEQYSDHYYVAQNATEHYIEIYCRRDEESKLPAFFIELSTHNRILTAFAENTIFLALEIATKWQPLAESARRMEFMRFAEIVIEKVFTVWHTPLTTLAGTATS